MNETTISVVGNVATQPVYRELASGASARFRMAVTARYLDRERRTWTDGHTSFYTVWSNRQLATNAVASLAVGDPVVVQGRLKVRTELREGQQSWTSAEIDAVAIGHDLARGTSAFRRAHQTGTAADRPAHPEPSWDTAAGPDAGPEAAPPAGPDAAPPAGPTPEETADPAPTTTPTTASETAQAT
jgi:single-strand DNA-binding protein